MPILFQLSVNVFMKHLDIDSVKINQINACLLNKNASSEINLCSIVKLTCSLTFVIDFLGHGLLLQDL